MAPFLLTFDHCGMHVTVDVETITGGPNAWPLCCPRCREAVDWRIELKRGNAETSRNRCPGSRRPVVDNRADGYGVICGMCDQFVRGQDHVQSRGEGRSGVLRVTVGPHNAAIGINGGWARCAGSDAPVAAIDGAGSICPECNGFVRVEGVPSLALCRHDRVPAALTAVSEPASADAT